MGMKLRVAIAALVLGCGLARAAEDEKKAPPPGEPPAKSEWDRPFPYQRFANGMSATFWLKASHGEVFDAAPKAFERAGLDLTKLSRENYVLSGTPAPSNKASSEIAYISIIQIQFWPRRDFRFTEWQLHVFWRDGIIKSRTDPTFAKDPEVTRTLLAQITRLYEGITKDIEPIVAKERPK